MLWFKKHLTKKDKDCKTLRVAIYKGIRKDLKDLDYLRSCISHILDVMESGRAEQAYQELKIIDYFCAIQLTNNKLDLINILKKG